MKKDRLISLILVLVLAISLLTPFMGAADETVPPDGADEAGVSAEAESDPEPPAGEPKEEPEPEEEPEPAKLQEPEEIPEPAGENPVQAEDRPDPEESPESVDGFSAPDEGTQAPGADPEEEPDPAGGEQPPAGEDPVEEEPKPAEEPAEQPGDEEPASFREGYVLIRQDTKAYADEAGRELLGTFTEDAGVYAFAAGPDNGAAGEILKIVFDTAELKEKNEPLQAAYLPVSETAPFTPDETARLEAEVEQDPDARAYEGRKIGLAPFAFAGKASETKPEEPGRIEDNGGRTTLFTAPSGTVTLGFGETVQILAKADNTSGEAAYHWEKSGDGGQNWTDAGCDRDLKAVSVTEDNYRTVYDEEYRCTVTDGRGTTRSASVKIAQPFTIKTRTSVKAGIGKKVKLTVKVSAKDKKKAKTAKYQWQVSTDGGATWQNCSYKGNRKKTLTVSVTMTRFFYRFRCLVTIGSHSMLSNTVSFRNPYTVKVSPAKRETAVGKTAKFSVKVKGVQGTIKYRWQVSTDGGKTWKKTKIKGYKTKTISVKVSENSYDAMYRCIVAVKKKGKAISPVVQIVQPGISKFVFEEQGRGWRIARYTGTDASVTIPSRYARKPVVAVGADAFRGNTALRTVTVPSPVTSIGAHAFAGCTCLSTVILSNGIDSIGAAAFENCTSLSNIRTGN